jgi:hypothetical protein
MGLFDSLFGNDDSRRAPPAPAGDEAAIARYRYLMRTAPPEMIEQAHAEAFAQLSPEARAQVLRGLADAMPEAERRTATDAVATPGQLARYATRAELRQPGAVERAFGSAGAMPGFGGMFAGSMLGSLAGVVLGSAVAQQFFATHPEAAAGAEAEAQAADDGAGGDAYSEASGSDAGFDDLGGDSFDV